MYGMTMCSLLYLSLVVSSLRVPIVVVTVSPTLFTLVVSHVAPILVVPDKPSFVFYIKPT